MKKEEIDYYCFSGFLVHAFGTQATWETVFQKKKNGPIYYYIFYFTI